MAASQPSLLDPDKFGLLVQCRQKMDKLNSKQLQDYAQSVLSLLSATQLKKLLFVGCNSIKNDIEYQQLFQMKSCINEVIDQINKEKRLKNKQKAKDIHKSPIATIPKDASLTKHIPSDIISNNICHYLKMSSITQLAQCDRQLAVICHTPTAICNLMHRYDPYRYNPREVYANGLIDGDYCNIDQWNPSTIHRFKNVEKLSISLEFFDQNASAFTTMFSNLKHLSLFDKDDSDADYSPSYTQRLSLLESISFVHTYHFEPLLYIFKPHLAAQTHTLKSISFIDCTFDSLDGCYDDDHEIYSEYKNMVNFILPSESNKLEIIRFENSYFDSTSSSECQEANDQFVHLDRVRSSLSNLKGFVYSERINSSNSTDQFFHLSTRIVNNISSFKQLESIHIHCLNDPQLLTSFLNRNNMNIFNQITELCISVPSHGLQMAGSPLQCLSTLVTKLEKLCVVISISDTDSQNMSKLGGTIGSILRKQTKLKVFQMVIIMDETETDTERTDARFCAKRIVVLNQLLKKLVKSLNALLYDKSRPLVFRLHVKSCHSNRKPRCRTDTNRSDSEMFANTIQNLVLNYLMAYPLGKIQVKLSWNTYEWYIHRLLVHKSYLERLTQMFRVDIKKGGTVKEDEEADLYTDMDFKKYAICASNKDTGDKDTHHHENKWKVDCRYCCNTPWV